MQSSTIIYFLEYKDGILALVVILEDDLNFYYNFETNFDDMVYNLFYKRFILLLTGECNEGIIRANTEPILPDTYDTILVTFIKKYKGTIKTVVFSEDEQKLNYYNDIKNSNKYMHNLTVQKKLNGFLHKDNETFMYFWGLNDTENITNEQYENQINKNIVWPE